MITILSFYRRRKAPFLFVLLSSSIESPGIDQDNVLHFALPRPDEQKVLAPSFRISLWDKVCVSVGYNLLTDSAT